MPIVDAPAVDAISRRAWVTLMLTSVGQMMTTFAGSAINVGFPAIEADLGAPRTTLAWTISGYSIAAAAFLLAAGRAADRLGGRRVFLSGVGLFIVGAALATAAPSAEVLIGARVLQGLGSASMIPSSLSLALHEFPLSRRSMAVGVWGGIAAIAGASGPPIGAALIALGSWRLVFASSIPIGLIVVVLGLRILRDPPPREVTGRVDLVAGPLASAAIGLLIAALLQSGRWGWGDPRVVAALVAAPVLLTFVVIRSARHPTPLLDLELFRNPRFVTASTLTTVYNASTAGFWLSAPLFLQTVWGWSALESGFGIIASPITHMLLAPPMSRLADRGRHRLLMIGGTTITAVGTGGLALLVDASSSYWTTMLPCTMLIGVGGAAAWPTFTSAALIGVAPEKYGQANGVNLTMRQLGGALGVAVVIAVIGNATDAGADVFRNAWALSAVSLVACAGAVAWGFPTERA